MAKVRLGAVSFLNSRPLVAGLEARGDVALRYDVPAALPQLLDSGAVDAALVPVIDVIRSGGGYRVVSDACIACDGETMTVRVFSQDPPDRIRTLWVDGDSHTSVALASVLWRELYGRELELRALEGGGKALDAFPAVLLIGDKVVDPRRGSFAYEVDLGGAWRQLTGLPFVFAVWAAQAGRQGGLPEGAASSPYRLDRDTTDRPGTVAGRASRVDLFDLLGAARDAGVRAAEELARLEGPRHGWPAELARRYLTRCLKFRLTQRCLEGVSLFARLCAQAGLTAPGPEIAWPERLLPVARV